MTTWQRLFDVRHYYRGRLCASLGLTRAALAAFEKSVRTVPTKHRAYGFLADALDRIGRGPTVEERAGLAAAPLLCLFVGNGRTGHTLVGAMLDAHPQALVGVEMDLTTLYRSGLAAENALRYVFENSRAFAAHGRQWTGYDYRIAGQFHGAFKSLRVLGESHVVPARYLPLYDREFVGDMERWMGKELRFVHVYRNPFDTIATIHRRHVAGYSLGEAADLYFERQEQVERAKACLGCGRFVDLRHEDVIERPREELARLCGFLDLSAESDYLDACAAVVFPSPRPSRERVSWPERTIDEIRSRIAGSTLLAGYDL